MSIDIQDLEGFHNKDSQMKARLLKGGSWKKQRIIVIVPASDSIRTKVYLSHWNLLFPPNNGVAKIATENLEVGEAYSKTIEMILEHPELSKWEYILTLEHDNTPPQDGVLKLLERMEENPKLSAIGGLYFTKGLGGVAQIWGDINDPIVNFRPQIPNGGLHECHGTGMGFTLFRLKMFKDPKLRRPWFVTQTKGGISTQDLYFWADARKYGYRCAIDCTVKVGHVGLDEFGEEKVW